MVALAVGDTSDCSRPVLHLYTQVGGAIANPSALAFQIWTATGLPTQVYPSTSGQRATVDVVDSCPVGHQIETGHFVAQWTVPNGTTPGLYEIRWFITPVVGAVEQVHHDLFEILATAIRAFGVEPYAFVADLRAEGVSSALASDERAYQLLQRATEAIDRVTGLFFRPREGAYVFDGPGRETIFLQIPIVALTSLSIDQQTVDLATVSAYSRHLTQNLLTPDDRRNPRIQRRPEGDLWDWWSFQAGYRFFARGPVWPKGLQNIYITGIFGWTEPTGATAGPGAVPAEIRSACTLLACRELELYSSPDRVASRRLNEIRSEGTRDQSVSYDKRMGLGRLIPPYGTTGDPEVDAMVARFRPPMKLGVT